MQSISVDELQDTLNDSKLNPEAFKTDNSYFFLQYINQSIPMYDLILWLPTYISNNKENRNNI